MAQDSFKQQFPDYPLIPEKKRSKLLGWTVIVLSMAGLVVLFGTFFLGLSKINLPTPLMAGYTEMSLETLRNQGLLEAEAGNHITAIKAFSQYFKLGGDDADAMAVFALSLEAQGQSLSAAQWAKKSVEKDPNSKTADFVRRLIAD